MPRRLTHGGFAVIPHMAPLQPGFKRGRFYQVYGLLEFQLNNLSLPETGILRRYLGTLTVLEMAVPRSAENLDTDIAAVWTRNRDETRDRTKLFDDWRRRLCGFLGIPPGPALSNSGISLVV